MHRKKILDLAIQTAEMNNHINPARPLLEICGNNRLLIENHKGVCEYSDNTVLVKIIKGRICICGSQLQISFMSKERLIIIGQIETLQFFVGEKYDKTRR